MVVIRVSVSAIARSSRDGRRAGLVEIINTTHRAVCNNGGGRRVEGATVTPHGGIVYEHAQACNNSIYM